MTVELTAQKMREIAMRSDAIMCRCYVCQKFIENDAVWYEPIIGVEGELVEVQGIIGALEYFELDKETMFLSDKYGDVELFLIPKSPQFVGKVEINHDAGVKLCPNT